MTIIYFYFKNIAQRHDISSYISLSQSFKCYPTKLTLIKIGFCHTISSEKKLTAVFVLCG